jgi:D-threo-aldose 1-dehydrogenase
MTGAIARRSLRTVQLELTELGFGAAAMGNLYAPVSDAAARETLDAAIGAGFGYFDTAPYYGFGLSERRVGDAVREDPGLVLSTKVGRLLEPDASPVEHAERHGFWSPMPFRPVFDYRYDAVLRSFEDSLQRLGLARVDILYVHDIGRLTHGEAAASYMAQLIDGGGLRALERLRASGLIRAVGIGVNEIEICCELLNLTQLDVILLAGRYTLLEQQAVTDLFPLCERVGTSIVVGGPYNSGILAEGVGGSGTAYYNYGPAPSAIVERVRRIERICDRHGVPLKAAALQFPLGHPVVASVIPGLRSPAQVQETTDLYRLPIPADLWSDLRREGLLVDEAPVLAGAPH